MRTIKFRGKRIDNGEWVYGNLVTMDSPVKYGNCTIASNYWIVEIEEELMTKAFASGNSVWALNTFIQVIPATVAQFTGSKDKFGTEIYENHIVKQTYHAQSGSVHDGSDEDFTGHHIGKVVITTSKGVCMKHPLNYSDNTEETFETNQYKNVSGRRCEVIGDIHSNPELLEVKA